MKKFYLLLWSCLLLTACSDPDDQPSNQNDQNNLPEIDQRSLDLQLDFVQFVEPSQSIGGQLTRMYYLFGNTYEEWYDAEFYASYPSIVSMWSKAYEEILPGIDETLALDSNQEYPKHQGVLKIIKAYTLMTLTDYFGPIPFEAGWPADAQVAEGEAVYSRVMDLLEEAEEHLQEAGPDLETDVFYNNQFDNWSRLAGSLKLNVLTNQRLVNSQAQAQFNAIIASGDYIQSNAQNFEFRYGSGLAEPFDMHPLYRRNYFSEIPWNYQSNAQINTMLSMLDPRIRFYYFRQNQCTPGASCQPAGNQTVLQCSIDPLLQHYPADMVQCWVEEGYWGRDHGNPEGIPPDAFARTIPGLYPAAGNFDDDSYANVYEVNSAQGAGILPIVQSHDADWLQAEWALVNGDASLARQFIMVGTQKSIDRVMAFSSLDPDLNPDYLPTATQITQFISAIGQEFDQGDMEERWSLFQELRKVAQFGNGISMYASYRRTGYPTYLQYHVNPQPGPFPRSLYYPDDAVGSNPNLNQKPNLAVQVFWDTNPAYPVFPAAN